MAMNQNLKSDAQAELDERQKSLQDRINRLQHLLIKDDEEYTEQRKAIYSLREQSLETLQKQLQDIQDRKEEARQQLVKEKLEQCWRENSDDFRKLRSQGIRRQLGKEHIFQVEMKQQQEKAIKEEEAELDSLQRRVAEEKVEKEIREKDQERAREKEIAKEQLAQIAASKKKKREQQRIKEEEDKLLVQQQEMLRQERQRCAKEQHNQKKEWKQDLEQAIQQKLKLNTEKAQANLKYDLEFSNSFIWGKVEDPASIAQKKRELLEQQKQFLAEVTEQAKSEVMKQKELDTELAKAATKYWERHEMRWQAEKRARENLTKESLQQLQKQIQMKLKAESEKRNQLQQEQERLHLELEQRKSSDKERRQQLHESRLAYRQALEDQINYAKKVKN